MSRKNYLRQKIIRLRYTSTNKERVYFSIINSIRRKIKILFSRVYREFDKALHPNRVLIVCNGLQMEQHIKDFISIVKHEARTSFEIYISYKANEDFVFFTKSNNISIISEKQLYGIIGHNYKCIVCPDSFARYILSLQFNRPKLLYINHGFHIVGRDNGKQTYAYYELFNKCHFDIMLEPNKRIAKTISEKELNINIVFTGWKFAEYEKQAMQKRKKYLDELGISNNKKIVFIVSTWGDNSLFHSMGPKLFTEIERLKDKYYFILSAHPNEYSLTNGCGSLVDEQEKKGIRVRHINEDWIPFLSVADVVISDYSTIVESAINNGKKVVLSCFPQDAVWNESVIAKVNQYLPHINEPEDLDKIIETTINAELPEKISNISRETYVTRKQYEKNVLSAFRKLFE